MVGNMKYIRSHSETVERFLVGYIQAVNYLNNALANPQSDEYREVVEIAVNKCKVDKKVVEDALDNVTYTYADNEEGELTKLKADIVSLTDSLEEMGLVSHSMKDLGFAYTSQFVN